MKITDNFHDYEFFVSESNPQLVDSWESVSHEVRFALQLLANRLQVLRDMFGRIKITSGYRGPQLNEAVGGHPNSRHMRGMAADIVFLDTPTAHVAKKIKNWSGGFNYYEIEDFIHVDIGHRARW